MLKFISAVIAAVAFAGVLTLLSATSTRIEAPQSMPVIQIAPAPAAVAISPELVRLEVARDLAVIRNSVEQLANKVEELTVKQDQMSQNIVASQAVEQDITQERSSPPAPTKTAYELCFTRFFLPVKRRMGKPLNRDTGRVRFADAMDR
jgi:hypothetical protein